MENTPLDTEDVREYKRRIFVYKSIKINDISTFEVKFLSIVPKKIDISYVKELITELYTHFEVEQYIKKMIWNKSTTVIPSIYFPDCPKEKFDLMHKLHKKVCEILGKLWDLGDGTPASEIPIDM